MNTKKKGIGIFIVAILAISVFVAMCVPVSAIYPVNSDWSTVTPGIDGNFSEGEWKNAQLLIEDPIHTYVYFTNDGEHLYVCVDAANAAGGDYTANDSDYCHLYFDTGHDEVWTWGHEDAFTLYGNGDTEHLVAISPTYILHCTDWASNHIGLQGAAGFGESPNSATDHRIYEFKIPLNLLSASPGDTIGFASPNGPNSLPYDADMGRHNIWPPGADINNLSTWGDLILASPPAVPALTPLGIIALVGLLSGIAAISISTSIRKKRR